jgi:ABC-type transporter Mla subunit MlaD
MNFMGYILPYLPIQRMQYASRMERSKQGIPEVPTVPPVQNEIIKLLNQKKSKFIKDKKQSFRQVLIAVEGKGATINETI